MTCAGKAKFLSSHPSLFKVDSNSWILDSGASEHMNFNRTFFNSFKLLPKPILVTLPNSHRETVTHSGSVHLLSDLPLHNVFYIPSLKFNILSVHKLCNQLQKFHFLLLTIASCCRALH